LTDQQHVVLLLITAPAPALPKEIMGLVTLSLCSHVPCLPAARMWPYITEAGEKKARAMLPDMLDKNKPTWMTTLKLNE